MNQTTNMTNTKQGTAAAARRVMRALGAAAAFGAGCLVCLSAAAQDATTSGTSVDTQAPFVTESNVKSSHLNILLNKSVTLETRTPYKRVSVAQPEVADVNLLDHSRLLVTGKKAGGTQIVVWDDGDRAQVVDVTVQVDVAGLQEQLKRLFPGTKVEVSANNSDVILRGTVPSIDVEEQIVRIATPYGAKVQDFTVISGGQQVMLSVKFAEVSRAASDSLGVNLGISDGRSFFGNNIGGVNPFGTADNGAGGQKLTSPSPGGAVTLFGQGMIGQTTFQAFVEALRQNSLLRVLAEPNLLTVSGQEASFLAGGAIPVPVSQGGTGSAAAISVDYREYGVKLKFVPIVLGNGKIRLKVSPEISDLDYANSVTSGGFKIPGITQRKVTTTIELADGQSFAIAGLLNTSIAANKDVTPLLGDLPVIGPAFRTVRYSRKETEMVVLVTPHLVEPLNPADVQRLPGEEWRSPSENELFWNADLGGEVSPKHVAPTATGRRPREAPKFHGEFGFVPAQSKDGTSDGVMKAPYASTKD